MASIKKRPERKYRAKPWRARYRDEGGREHAAHFATKAAAQLWLDKETASLVRGDWVDPKAAKTTYGAWSDQYFTGAVHKRATTLARDQTVNAKHFVPVFGSRALSSIRPLDVRRVIQQMSKTHAPKTVHTNYGVLRAVLNAAVAAELIAVSPCRGVKLPALGPRKIRFLTAEELERLAAAMPVDYRPIV
jgi:hypothetical protein